MIRVEPERLERLRADVRAELHAIAHADGERAAAERAGEMKMRLGVLGVHANGATREHLARLRESVAPCLIALRFGEIDFGARGLPERLVIRRIGTDRRE